MKKQYTKQKHPDWNTIQYKYLSYSGINTNINTTKEK